MTPTQSTLKEMRKRGYTCQVVERWNPYAKIRQDLFGFVDVVCLGDGEIIGVQATTTGNQAKRVSKILGLDAAQTWLKSGARLFVHGWKVSKRTRRRELTEREITMTDFDERTARQWQKFQRY